MSGLCIGPCYWPTEVPIDEFWPLSDEPLGYIAMNGHGGPRVVLSERKEYDVLVPIYGLTAQDGRALYNTEMVSRGYNGKLISVWVWPDLDRNFDVKLAPWPFGHYLTATSNKVDGFDNTSGFTDNFNEDTYSESFTNFSAGSYYPQGFGSYYSFVPHASSSSLALALGPSSSTAPPLVPAPSPAQSMGPSIAPEALEEPNLSSQGLVSPDATRLTANTFSEDLRWTKTIPDQNARCQLILAELGIDHPWAIIVQSMRVTIMGIDFNPGTRFRWHHLRETYDHKPNSMISDLRKVLGHCMKPGEDMGFCKDLESSYERVVRMSSVIDNDLQAIDWQVIVEIIKLQMSKELWYYMLLHPISTQPSCCVADVYWDQIVDQDGNPSMTIIALIVCLFYEWCQKSLQMNLDKTGNARVIKIYSRVIRIIGVPLDMICEAARDLAHIKEFNVYGMDKDGKRKRANVGPIVQSHDTLPTFQGPAALQHLQHEIPMSFFQ
ncbi:hypothetical protein C8R48DRAFT_778415 [Suillus tomentosus]|nr:hypothetical protein C8R48DRAFT_778415 [Suillus tomentosus]